MNINIIGGSGTGKSFIAEKMKNLYNIPHYDLDNIFWDNTAISYGVKMPIEKRTGLLNKIIETDNWILEGVYYKWLINSFSSCDFIFIIKSSQIICNIRIIKRFLKRKFGIQKGKKETIKSLIDLLKWTKNYQENEIPIIINYLNEYRNKIIVVKNPNSIIEHINNRIKTLE